MTHRVFAWLLVLAGCVQSHSGVEALGQTDCATCHIPRGDYDGTTAVSKMDPAVPDHPGNSGVYTTQCADCHVTTTWYSHPEKLFPLANTAHAQTQCTQCHANPDDNAGDARGANTQCATCHTATEMVAGQTLTDDHIKHPDAIFPQNHKRENGGVWACTDCHTGKVATTFDGYQNPPAGFTGQNFCLSCHPDGKSSNKSSATCSGAPCHAEHHSHNLSRGDPAGCLGCHPHGDGGGN